MNVRRPKKWRGKKRVLTPRVKWSAESLADSFAKALRLPIRPDPKQEQALAAIDQELILQRRVPLPYALGGPGRPRGRPPVYPWRTMAVGESFECASNSRSVGIYCRRQGRRLGRLFKHKGQLVWRVS